MEPPAIKVTQLEQRYGDKLAVCVPHLEVSRGEVLVILGPNGSGKSTLLRVLGLLERPFRGSVAYRGRVPVTQKECLDQRRRMAMVFQDPLLFKGSVFRNVSYGPRVRGMGAGASRQEVKGALDLLGIGHLEDRPVDTLSGGEAQRVALARALAVKPEVFFLDEPTAYLDAPAKEAFVKDLRGLLDRLGLTALFVTHDRSEALALGARVAVLEAGHLRQEGDALEVFRRPATLSLAAFLGAEVLGSGRVQMEGSRWLVKANGGAITVNSGEGYEGEVDLVMRPEDVNLSRGGSHEPGLNALTGLVSEIIPSGHAYRVTLDCGFRVRGYLTGYQVRCWQVSVGDSLTASFYPDAVHLIPRSS
jgi:tungstate transport system ATP-binding protein